MFVRQFRKPRGQVLPPFVVVVLVDEGAVHRSLTGREIDEFFEEFEPVKVRLRTQKGAREVDVVPMPWDRDARHRWTYALVQFRTVDDAQRAMDACRERQLPDGRYPRIEFTQPRDDPDEDERHLEPWT